MDEGQEQLRDHVLNQIREIYSYEYYNSTISHHFFLRTAPIELQRSIESLLIWNDDNNLRNLLRRQLGGSSWIIISDVYHEIYLMRPEIDFIDTNKAHYDGILKRSKLLTLRSLSYLEGTPATFVAVTSQVNYTTHVGSTIIIDFNNELYIMLSSTMTTITTITATITT